MKNCTKCFAWKPNEDFCRDRSKEDGRQNACKKCNNDIYKGRAAREVNVWLRRWGRA